ncbi:TPA: hypothetical protein ACMX4R_000053 [Yersinia enterocolitica]
MSDDRIFYAKVGDDGKIIYIAQGEQQDPTMILVDYSSELYHEFYYRMPIWIQWDIPVPTEIEV